MQKIQQQGCTWCNLSGFNRLQAVLKVTLDATRKLLLHRSAALTFVVVAFNVSTVDG